MFIEKEFPENIVPSQEFALCLQKSDFNTEKAQELMTKRMLKRNELKEISKRMTDALFDWSLGKYSQANKELNEEIYLDGFQACEHIISVHLNTDS